jgi:glycine oxidase
MRQPEHIAIAGGGIIGLACALLLKDRGLEVTVFEAGEAVREASWAAGGMLAAEDPENPAALLPFSRYSRALYPSFLQQVEVLSGHRVSLRTHQTIQIVDPKHPVSAGVRLSRDEAISLVPGLAQSDHSYLLLEEASLDPRELCTALRSAVTVAGVALHEYEPVLSVEREGGAVFLATGRRMMHADAFVNCCGAWAASLNAVAAVAPSKGQMLVITQPEGPQLTCVLRSPEVYLIPRRLPSTDDSRIVIGATVEDAGYSRQVDPAALSLLRRRAAALWPPAADALEVESWAGLRPATADGLPLIGLIEHTGPRDRALPEPLSSRPKPSRASETGAVEGSAVSLSPHLHA